MAFGDWPGLGALGRIGEWMLEKRIAELEKKVAERGQPVALAAAKIRAGANVSREEAAAFLGVNVKTLQRLEAKGRLERCPGLGGAVRYRASDVLKLASARPWKED